MSSLTSLYFIFIGIKILYELIILAFDVTYEIKKGL